MNKLKKICIILLISDLLIFCLVYIIPTKNYLDSFANNYNSENEEISYQDKILTSVDKIAWPENTPDSEWKIETGNFKDDSIRDIYKELGYETETDVTICGHFVDAVIYDALNIKIQIIPKDAHDPWTELPENFKIVHEGKIEDFELLPGDIIRYKKTKSNGKRSQHAFIYYGNELLAESGINNKYPIIRSIYSNNLIKKWDKEEVDSDTLQVIRIY